jgi:hypothetical protein
MNHTTKGVASPRFIPPPTSLVFSLLLLLSLLAASQLGCQSFSLPRVSRGSDNYGASSLVLRPLRTLLSSFHAAAKQGAATDLTVHEWGTFTSIAGTDGVAIDWLPLTGSTDLPSFVEHFRSPQFKGGLRGTIRMETPVLYFYSAGETNVSVNVSFSKGLITEWYPHADSVNSAFNPRSLSLDAMKSAGAISWNSVHIDPHAAADYPSDNSENHYYAARQTSAAPLELSTSSGQQREKFLFYRGVAAFLPPLTATFSPDGAVQLQSHFTEPIPDVILFERRGAQLGYRVLGPLRDQASLSTPALDGSLDSLFSDLEGVLVSQGLFPDEAHAMLETWKNSWFEEGSRVIYIVPRAFVDSVLPLTIQPAPSNTVRMFVGRLELISAATQQAVESAFVTGDRPTLVKYSRFLEPILFFMIQESTDESRQQRLAHYLDSLPITPDLQPNH